MRYLITLFLYLLLQNIAFSASIKDFTSRYEIYHNNFHVGTTTRKLKKEKDFLIFSSKSTTAGIASWFFDVTITEKSKLIDKNKQLHFHSFNYQKNKNGEKEGYQLNLKNPQQFYNTYKKKLFPVSNDLHDTLGFTVAIMYDLKMGKRSITYAIAKKRKIDNYQLEFLKEENLETNTGTIQTLKMEYFDQKKKKRVTIWCAPEMDYLPIKILNINNNGDENLLRLTHFNNKPVHLSVDEEEID